MAFITTGIVAGAIAGGALATAPLVASGVIGGAIIGGGAGAIAKNQMKKGEKDDKSSSSGGVESPKAGDIEAEQRREVQKKLGQRTRTVLTSPLGTTETPTLENKTLLGE